MCEARLKSSLGVHKSLPSARVTISSPPAERRARARPAGASSAALFLTGSYSGQELRSGTARADMDDRVKTSVSGGIADVRLVRADKMNALDPPMFEALTQTLARLTAAEGLRAVVLSGEGRAFCAG